MKIFSYKQLPSRKAMSKLESGAKTHLTEAMQGNIEQPSKRADEPKKSHGWWWPPEHIQKRY